MVPSIISYVNDIQHSLENKCYYSALALALTLPDMCGAIEYPESTVSERYIKWYDKYIGEYEAKGKDDLGGNNPWLSGEIVYNLRNTYLHQGNVGVTSDKVKEEANQIDKFKLVLGDGKHFWTHTFDCIVDAGEIGNIRCKIILVDVTYLCKRIGRCALKYYENNKERFEFKYDVSTQEEFLEYSEKEMRREIVEILNKKLKEKDGTKRIDWLPNQGRTSVDTKISIFDFESENQDKTCVFDDERESQDKREARVRSFFGRHFKKKIYVDKKEEIIGAVLNSKSKLQVNNNLMKYFTSQEVGKIYKRLEPLLKVLFEEDNNTK